MLIKIGDATHDVVDPVGIYVQQLEKKVVNHAKELKTVGDKAVKQIREKAERTKLTQIAQDNGFKVDDNTSIAYLRGIGDSITALNDLTPTRPTNRGGSDLDFLNDMEL